MKDNFENFLKEEINKSKIQLPDNGFSDEVIKNLPQRKKQILGREIIIVFSTLVSAVVFILINGFNSFLTGLIHLIKSFLYFETLNNDMVFVVLAFLLISLSIPYVELRKRIF